MGCAISKFDSDVILQCKERRNLIKKAVGCREDFTIAHEAYIQTLKNVGRALRMFSEGGDEDEDEEEEKEEKEGEGEGEEEDRDEEERVIGGEQEEGKEEEEEERKPFKEEEEGASRLANKGLIHKNEAPPLISAVRTVIESQSSVPIESQSSVPIKSGPAISILATETTHESPPLPVSTPASEIMAPQAFTHLPSPASPIVSEYLSPPFYSPRNDNNSDEDYNHTNNYNSNFNGNRFEYDGRNVYNERTTHSSPPPSYTSSSSWFLFDIFEPPPIPYHLLENRRRRRRRRRHSYSGPPNEYEYEEEEEVVVEEEEEEEEHVEDENVRELDRMRRDEGIPELEEEELNGDREQGYSYRTRGSGNVKESTKVEIGKDKVESSSLENAMLGKSMDNDTKKSNHGVERSNGNIEKDITMTPNKAPPEEIMGKEKPKAFVAVENGWDFGDAILRIHTHFSRAHRSGKEVSDMLKTQLAVHHLSGIDLTEPSKVFNAIKRHWSQRTTIMSKDIVAESECGMAFGSHASTLERIHAWEKKLCEEVKAGELIRMAFDRKRNQLYNLDATGGDREAIDKTRATLRDLENCLEVALKAIQLASSRIQKLTNEELYPQFVALARGLMNMWKVMAKCHNAQKAIALEMRIIENSGIGYEASVAHISANHRLKHELENWNTHFRLWIKSQRTYIDTLYAWLWKCWSETGSIVSNDNSDDQPQLFHLLSSWRNSLRYLECRDDAIDVIGNFSAALHSSEGDRQDDLSLKKYAERSLRRLEKNYTMSNNERTNMDQHNHLDVLQEWREQTLLSIKEHLPLIFDAMANFARDASKAYETLQQNNVLIRENGRSHDI